MNSLFRKYFSTFGTLSETAHDAVLLFCPGFLDFLQCSEPPDISFLKSLPTDIDSKFAVCCLIFIEEDFVPSVYIGSGTEAQYIVSQSVAQIPEEFHLKLL